MQTSDISDDTLGRNGLTAQTAPIQPATVMYWLEHGRLTEKQALLVRLTMRLHYELSRSSDDGKGVSSTILQELALCLLGVRQYIDS